MSQIKQLVIPQLSDLSAIFSIIVDGNSILHIVQPKTLEFFLNSLQGRSQCLMLQISFSVQNTTWYMGRPLLRFLNEYTNKIHCYSLNLRMTKSLCVTYGRDCVSLTSLYGICPILFNHLYFFC
jgi:hypothetical protein